MEILKSNETKITLNVVIRDASEFYIVKSTHMIKSIKQFIEINYLLLKKLE